MEFKSDEGDFETLNNGDTFQINVTQEGDCSNDDGWSFETQTNIALLTKKEVTELIAELQEWLKIKNTVKVVTDGL